MARSEQNILCKCSLVMAILPGTGPGAVTVTNHQLAKLKVWADSAEGPGAEGRASHCGEHLPAGAMGGGFELLVRHWAMRRSADGCRPPRAKRRSAGRGERLGRCCRSGGSSAALSDLPLSGHRESVTSLS